MAHTPGPWHVASGFTVIGGEHAVASCNTFTAQQQTDDRREDNARLIAAAPDLWSLADTIRVWLIAPDLEPHTLDSIRNQCHEALKRATGKAVQR